MKTISGTPDMSRAEFYRIPNGTRVFNHGADECVALVNLYLQGVLGVPLPQSRPDNTFSAHMLWTNYPNDANLKKHFTRSGKPKPGAIAVWRQNEANGWQGHTGVVTSVLPGGWFRTREQNYEPSGKKRWLYRYNRLNDGGVYGFLLPRKLKAPPKPPAAEFEKGGNLDMGYYTYDQEISASDDWQRLKVNDKGAITIRSGQFTGLAVVNVYFRGTPGQEVEITVTRDTLKSGKTASSSRLRAVSDVIPASGVLKMQMTAGLELASNQRARVKVLNKSKKPVTVTRIAWDTLGSK